MPKYDDTDPVQLRRVLFSALSRKNVWKNRCIVGWTVALMASAAALFFALRDSPAPRPAPSAKTPNRVLASVWFNGCSGTFVSKGELGRILCCGHAFGQVGQEVEFYRADGHTGRARVIRIDFQHELSELICHAADVLAVTPVPEDLGETTTGEPNKSYSICGYPDGVGPTLHSLQRPYLSTVHEARSEAEQPAWQFKHSDSGNAWYGSSGCGIFADDYLISVQSNILPDDGGKTVYGCPHPELVRFLRTSKRKDCGNGLCPAPQSWKPRPNVPIEVNGEVAPPAYGGKGKPPEDLASCKALAAAIDKLRSEMAVLEKQVATLQKEWQDMRDTVPPPDDTPPAPAPQGLQGPKGAQGPQGPPGPAADLSNINAQILALQKQLAGVVSGLGSRGPQGPADPGVDLQQMQADLEGLKAFRKNLIGSRVTVPVR